jgi:hypothetical protein
MGWHVSPVDMGAKNVTIQESVIFVTKDFTKSNKGVSNVELPAKLAQDIQKTVLPAWRITTSSMIIANWIAIR